MRELVLPASRAMSITGLPTPGHGSPGCRPSCKLAPATIAVLGALHGDFAALPDSLVDLSDIGAADVLPSLMELGTLGTGEQKYMPWMQATYLMAANIKALEHLPEGYDINTWTPKQRNEGGSHD